MSIDTKEDESFFVDNLEDGSIFTEFLDVNFDAQEYANTIIESHVIGDALSKLTTGIDLLNKEIMAQVCNHHEDLLSQTTGIETLEGVVQSIQTRIQSLVKSVDRVRTQVTDPYNRIASRTRQLRRLQTTCEYLRRIIRILYLNKKLQLQLKAGSREITKAAQSLNELEYVVEGVDLSGLQVIEEDLKQIKIARVEVEKQAKQMLDKGLSDENQSLIGTALQVFYNLGLLNKQVDSVLTNSTNLVQLYIKEASDVSRLATTQVSSLGPGRAAMPTPGNTAAWRNGLWDQIENLMSKLKALCHKIFILEKVLSKKRDPVTHTCFIELFSEDNCSKIFNPFWNSICSILRSEFDLATQSSTHLRQAFEGEFPKLLRLFNEFWSQISEFVNSKHTTIQTFSVEVKTGFNQQGSNPLESLKSSLHPFENAYLSRSLSRLFDPINLVFPSGVNSVPSTDDLNSIIKAIISELNVSAVDEHLMVLVSRNVAKTIQLYITKCEEILETSPDARQLTGGLTTSQMRNASIVNSLFQLHTGVAEVLPNLVYPPQAAVNILDESLTGISSFMDVAVRLLLSSMVASLKNKLSRMHAESFSISTDHYHETAGTQSCSKFIEEIQDFISVMRSDYLSLYDCDEFLIERLEMLATKILELFVCHACLLRDISEGGKLKLAADMAQLEFAIAPLCRRIEDLGPSYKLFRAFRPLLFQTVEDIPSNSSLGESLPYSTVLHFLFSKAPPQLLSPHTVAGWTITQYCKWLDEHQDEHERLALIRGTLEVYTKKVRANPNNSEFPVVYTVMMKLLENETKH